MKNGKEALYSVLERNKAKKQYMQSVSLSIKWAEKICLKNFLIGMQRLQRSVRYPDRKEVKPLWEELYEAYYTELVAYGAHVSGSKELAEDLVQETYIRAMRNAATLEDLTPTKQRAWLYRTFKNLFLDRCRRAALENEYVQNLQSESMTEQGIQEIENAMLLQSISPEDRGLFQLRYLEGYTAKEISEMLGIPQGTIRSRLSRCRQKLKETITF